MKLVKVLMCLLIFAINILNYEVPVSLGGIMLELTKGSTLYFSVDYSTNVVYYLEIPNDVEKAKLFIPIHGYYIIEISTTTK